MKEKLFRKDAGTTSTPELLQELAEALSRTPGEKQEQAIKALETSIRKMTREQIAIFKAFTKEQEPEDLENEITITFRYNEKSGFYEAVKRTSKK